MEQRFPLKFRVQSRSGLKARRQLKLMRLTAIAYPIISINTNYNQEWDLTDDNLSLSVDEKVAGNTALSTLGKLISDGRRKIKNYALPWFIRNCFPKRNNEVIQENVQLNEKTANEKTSLLMEIRANRYNVDWQPKLPSVKDLKANQSEASKNPLSKFFSKVKNFFNGGKNSKTCPKRKDWSAENNGSLAIVSLNSNPSDLFTYQPEFLLDYDFAQRYASFDWCSNPQRKQQQEDLYGKDLKARLDRDDKDPIVLSPIYWSRFLEERRKLMK